MQMRPSSGFGNRSSNNRTGLAIALVLGARTLATLPFDNLLDIDGAALAGVAARPLFSCGIADVFIIVFFGSMLCFNSTEYLTGGFHSAFSKLKRRAMPTFHILRRSSASATQAKP